MKLKLQWCYTPEFRLAKYQHVLEISQGRAEGLTRFLCAFSGTSTWLCFVDPCLPMFLGNPGNSRWNVGPIRATGKSSTCWPSICHNAAIKTQIVPEDVDEFGVSKGPLALHPGRWRFGWWQLSEPHLLVIHGTATQWPTKGCRRCAFEALSGQSALRQ